MVTDSLLKKEGTSDTAKGKTLESLFGVWADDAEAEEMLEAVKEKRSGTTRHIVSLD